MKKHLSTIIAALILCLGFYVGVWADSKITALDELTAVASGDMLYVIDDPGGTPISKKITVLNLFDLINTAAKLETIANLGAYADSILAPTSRADFMAISNGLYYAGVLGTTHGSAVDDTDPPVKNGYFYDLTGWTPAVEILKFYDTGNDNVGDFVDGDRFGILMNVAVKIDYSTGTFIIGNAATDYTGSATQPVLATFVFYDGEFYSENQNDGFSDALTQALSVDNWEYAYVIGGHMNPDATNCLAVAQQTLNSGPMVDVSDCDDDADGTIDFWVHMPENWEGGTANEMKVGVHWVMHAIAGVDTQTVVWKAKLQARGNTDTVNNTWTADDTATTTFGGSEAQWDAYYTEVTIDAALSGAGGDTVFGRVTRDTTGGSSAANVYVTGIKLFYKVDALDALD